MLIFYIADNELNYELFNNPYVNIIPKIKEAYMHKYTRLAYKMKWGVQINQKYENAVIFKSPTKEKKAISKK